MRHRKKGRKFGMNPSARKAMLQNLVTSLFLHGQVRTTLARAKEARRYADRVITTAKRVPSLDRVEGLEAADRQKAQARRVHGIRRVQGWLKDPAATDLVFEKYAPAYRNRPGGYTRVLKVGYRAGDNSPMAILQLVEEERAPTDDSRGAAEE